MMALALMGSATSCRPKADPSPAADGYIEQAESEEEREALVEARDEIDAEQAARAAELDEEIERLRRENEELRERLEAAGR